MLQWTGTIETLLRGDEGPLRTIGIDQGSAISPATLDLRLGTGLDRPFTACPDNPPWYRWADNLVYLCRGVAEANRTVQRVAHQLTAVGFQLRGDEGPAVNLRRQGAWKLLLGFEVCWRDGGLQLGVPKKAWDTLRESLDQGHSTDNPGETAIQVVRDWLGNYGVGFGGVEVEGVVRRVMHIAAGVGFREIGSPSEVESCIRESRRRWDEARRKAGHRLS